MNWAKIKFLKIIDATIGWILCLLLPPLRRAKRPPNVVNSILFVRPGGIGDAILLLPVIRAFKQLHPDAVVSILAEKRNAAVFGLNSGVVNVYHYDLVRDFFKLLRESFDVVIDTEQWYRLSALVARCIQAEFSIGFDTNERRRCFYQTVSYSETEYELLNFWKLVGPLLKPAQTCPTMVLSIPEERLSETRGMLALFKSKKIIALFPGGSIVQKRWDRNAFRELGLRLRRDGYDLVIVGGKEDFLDGELIAGKGNGILNLCGRLSLLDTASILHAAELLITGDSGIMHIANGLGIKVVALFGPGNVQKWSPVNNNTVVVSKNLLCSPCSRFGFTPPCKNRFACMKLITVEEVYAKTVELLKR